MSISLSPMTIDTSVTYSPSSISPVGLNWLADWRKRNDGKILNLINTSAPTSYPENFRVSYSTVPDVYAGTQVARPLMVPVKSGYKIFVSLRSVYGLADSGDAQYEAALPIVSSLTLTVPNHQLMTDTVVENHIKRMLGFLYEQGSAAIVKRLPAIMRGILIPTGL